MKRILETPRLYFREFTIHDAAMLLEMHQDPEITRYTGDPIPWTDLAGTEKILREAILPQYKNNIGRWAVHLKATDEFLGWCGLKDTGDEIDLGYRYLRRYWGKGYATEAARAVLQVGRERNLKGIVGKAAVANTASVKILQRIGLIFKEYYMDDGVESVRFTAE